MYYKKICSNRGSPFSGSISKKRAATFAIWRIDPISKHVMKISLFFKTCLKWFNRDQRNGYSHHRRDRKPLHIFGREFPKKYVHIRVTYRPVPMIALASRVPKIAFLKLKFFSASNTRSSVSLVVIVLEFCRLAAVDALSLSVPREDKTIQKT